MIDPEAGPFDEPRRGRLDRTAAVALAVRASDLAADAAVEGHLEAGRLSAGEPSALDTLWMALVPLGLQRLFDAWRAPGPDDPGLIWSRERFQKVVSCGPPGGAGARP